jgi:hypothetical protein
MTITETKHIYTKIEEDNSMEDQTLFVKVMGAYPIIKVLDFLIMFQDFDYSLSDICKNAGVGWSTLHRFWPQLEKYELVKKTREVGNANMYKLNTENEISKQIMQLNLTICEKFGGPEKQRIEKVVK